MPTIPDRLFARPPWERMMHIHERIKAGRYPNCSTLAGEIEVCPRTIKRDLDFMKFRLKLPLEYDERRYGYYYTEAVDRFPGPPLTEAEIFALMVAHKAISQYRGTPFHEPLQIAFQRLTHGLDSHGRYTLGSLDQALSFRPFAPEDTDLRKFQTIAQAVQEQRQLRFQYKKLGTRRSAKRHVRPLHLACIENHWYLFAYDVDRQAIRTFVLTRLTEPQLSKKRFKRPKNFDPDNYLKGSFSVFKGHDDYEVVIDFDMWATGLIRGRQWHASQQFTELPDGSSRLSMRLNNIEEIEQWVLSWGAHATVVRPKALATRIRKTAVKLVKRYGN